MIGREAELGAIAELLGTARLVTLVGPAGTGKTSLAMRLAADLLPGFPDGAFVALLAPVADVGLVAMATAEAIGLREQTGRTEEGEILSRRCRARPRFARSSRGA